MWLAYRTFIESEGNTISNTSSTFSHSPALQKLFRVNNSTREDFLMQITIALLQMTSFGNDQRANLFKGEDFCRRAHDMGADLALFPERWNIGYTPYLSKDQEVLDLR